MTELVDVFLEENKKLNLSALRTRQQCEIGNVLDSLAFTDLAPNVFGASWKTLKLKLLDLGTGGGFPLLPMAIAMPSATLIGLDAVKKKADAVERIVAALGLKNVHMLSDRAEVIGRDPELRSTFDVVTARAVAPLATLLEYAVPLLKVHGLCVFWKSLAVQDELAKAERAARLLRVTLRDTFTYRLPADYGERCLVVYEKQSPTPEEFPRKVGIPKLKPL